MIHHEPSGRPQTSLPRRMRSPSPLPLVNLRRALRIVSIPGHKKVSFLWQAAKSFILLLFPTL